MVEVVVAASRKGVGSHPAALAKVEQMAVFQKSNRAAIEAVGTVLVRSSPGEVGLVEGLEGLVSA